MGVHRKYYLLIISENLKGDLCGLMAFSVLDSLRARVSPQFNTLVKKLNTPVYHLYGWYEALDKWTDS